VFGSPAVVSLLAGGLDDVVGAKFVVEPDPAAAALWIRRHIEAKRRGLGLPAVEIDVGTPAGTPTAVAAAAGSEG